MRFHTNNLRTKLLVILLTLSVALGNVACDKSSVEKSIATTVRAIKSARQVTTLQHSSGYITDEQYRARLVFFRSLYVSVDALGDKITAFGEINATNKVEILAAIRGVNAQVIDLINTSNLGIKNPQSKADFSKWVLLASGTLSSVEVAIAASKKTINTKNVTVEKLNE